MIGSHEGWNDLEVMSFLNPAQTSNILFPLDHHDGSYKVETSGEGNKFFNFYPTVIENSRPQGVVKTYEANLQLQKKRKKKKGGMR